jgi:hypothetical protein
LCVCVCVCVCLFVCLFVCLYWCMHAFVRFQLCMYLHFSVFSFQILETYHLMRYNIQYEWVSWLLYYEDTLFSSFCFVGSHRNLVQISDTVLLLYSTFLSCHWCITSSNWVSELTAALHVKPHHYSCDTSCLCRNFRDTALRFCCLLQKFQDVNTLFQTLFLCITFSTVCLNLNLLCACVRVCVRACVQLHTYSGILHWIKPFWCWYFIVITIYNYNFRNETIGNPILEEK